MLISVIVPIFNAEQTLAECVNSVLCEKSPDFELILVDDGSSDASARLCDAFAAQDPRVVVIHQVNQGLACARNAGMRKARGNYIAHLDSDDFLLENWFSKISNETHVYPHADVLVWGMNQLIEGVLIPDNGLPDAKACYLKGADAFKLLFCSNLGTFWHSVRYVVKRSCILEKKLFYRAGVLHEDIDFNPYLVLAAEQVHVCADAYYVYRRGREGATTSRVTVVRCRDMILLVKRWFDFLKAAELDQTVADGFRAELSRNLWNFVPEVLRFPDIEKDELLGLLAENKDALMWVRIPLLSAFVKRGLLACLGLKATAMALGMLRAIRRR